MVFLLYFILLDHRQNKTRTKSCYNGKGEKYRGKIKNTVSGKQCANWRSNPYLDKMVFPELRKNYCRNPQGYADKPWCYTDMGTRKWEYCEVDECKRIAVTGMFQKQSFSTVFKPSTLLWSSFAAFSLQLILQKDLA